MVQKRKNKLANVRATTVHRSISAVTRCHRHLIKKRHMINCHVSKTDGKLANVGATTVHNDPTMIHHIHHDTLSAATRKETAYDQSSSFKPEKENRHTLPNHGSKMDKDTCKCGGNYGPPFDQCRDTLSVAPHKETAYDQSPWFKNGQRNLQMWGQLRSTVRSVP